MSIDCLLYESTDHRQTPIRSTDCIAPLELELRSCSATRPIGRFDDPVSLRKTFELAGFREIVERRIGEATDPAFEAVELRTRAADEDMRFTNMWGAMAFEAVR